MEEGREACVKMEEGGPTASEIGRQMEVTSGALLKQREMRDGMGPGPLDLTIDARVFPNHVPPDGRCALVIIL